MMLFIVSVALVGQLAPLARADAVSDCNESLDAGARIAGCDAIIASMPAADVLAVALMNRGIGHAQRGELDLALEDLDSALQTMPGMLAAHYNRGNVNLDLGRVDAAIADFTVVIEGAPDFALAWLNRGLAHERAGSIEAARSDVKRALALEPNLEAARRALARLRRAR